MKRIMVRADDLGYSEAVNYGISKTVHEGIIRNVGFMVNMPASRHGFDLIRDADVCLGQHTNICVGRPVSDPAKIPSMVQENGCFKSSRTYRSTKEDFVVLEEAIIEVEAQYARFKEITGREPQYFEGHAVESANFFKALEIVADRHNLKNIGMSSLDSLDAATFNGQKMYMWMSSMEKDYDPAAALRNMVEHSHEDGYDMMVFHPGYLDQFILNNSSLTIPRTMEVEAACSEEIKQYLKERDIKLYTYSEI